MLQGYPVSVLAHCCQQPAGKGNTPRSKERRRRLWEWRGGREIGPLASSFLILKVTKPLEYFRPRRPSEKIGS